jgi:hypothetical protein
MFVLFDNFEISRDLLWAWGYGQRRYVINAGRYDSLHQQHARAANEREHIKCLVIKPTSAHVGRNLILQSFQD